VWAGQDGSETRPQCCVSRTLCCEADTAGAEASGSLSEAPSRHATSSDMLPGAMSTTWPACHRSFEGLATMGDIGSFYLRIDILLVQRWAVVSNTVHKGVTMISRLKTF